MIKYFAAVSFVAVIIVVSFFDVMPKSELDILKEQFKRPDNPVTHPLKNPFTEKKSELGKILFYDPRLSKNGIMGCHTCHNPSLHYTDGMDVPRGHNWLPDRVAGFQGGRRTMTILNVGTDELILWDGVAETLEDHPVFSIEAARGTNIQFDDLVEKLSQYEEYKKLFKEAFDTENYSEEKVTRNMHLRGIRDNDFINRKTISFALATYQRTLLSGDAPFDEWVNGDEDAISESAKRGFKVFTGKGNCSSCHDGWNFSGSEWVDVGVDDNLGRAFSAGPNFRFQTKPPTLRNIYERPPYLHNGMYDTLEEVVDFFDRGGNVKRDSLNIQPLGLTDQEKADLVEFLKSLTSEDPPITVPRLPVK